MTRKPFSLTVVVSVVVAGVIGLTRYLRADSAPPTMSPRTSAPDWELKDVNGQPVKLSDFKGKVVILDFWATWCGPCRMEIPGFVELRQKYADQGLAVIGVSLDEGPEVVQSFMKRLAVNYPVVMGNSKIADDYGGIEAVPTTFLINRKGMIAAKHVGFTDKKEFEAEIKVLLRERGAD